MTDAIDVSADITPAQREALLAVKERQNSFEHVNLIPRDMVRHALFAGTNFTTRSQRLSLKNQQIVSTNWLTITVDGEQFGQRELDIYSSLLALAAGEGDYSFEVKIDKLLKRLGISSGTVPQRTFFSDLERLTSTTLKLKIEKTTRDCECSGSLIRSYSRTSSDSARTINGRRVEDALAVKLNPEYGVALAGSLLFVSARERRLLRDSPLAGWLFNYFKVHYTKHTITIGDLKLNAGLHEIRTNNLKRQLQKAEQSLAKVNIRLDIPSRLELTERLQVIRLSLALREVSPKPKGPKPPERKWHPNDRQKLEAEKKKIEAKLDVVIREERQRAGLLPS